jgi:ribonuclease HI
LDATSNIAEYLGLIDGLGAMIDMGVDYDPVMIYGDAKTIIHQMKGKARVSTRRVRPMYHKARRLADQLYVVDWRWIPRKQNKIADQLARLAYREIRANPKSFADAWLDVLQDHMDHRCNIRELGGMLVYQPVMSI